jgi:hypothetical protein
MRPPLRLLAATALALATYVVGCEPTPLPPPPAGTTGASSSGADTRELDGPKDAGAHEGGPTVAVPPPVCPEAPLARSGKQSVVTVDVELTYRGQRVIAGETLDVPGGGTLTLSNFRFYLSDVTLASTGTVIPVDIVRPDATPVAYNVHLVNADDEDGLSFRIAAPAGEYDRMTFLFGLNDACNARNPAASKPPLTPSSEMTWPPPFGYLFLRYEAVVAGITGKDAALAAIAMGGLPGAVGAPRVEAMGPLRVSASGGKARLRVALEQIFAAVALPADLSAIPITPLPEMIDGEHLRQNAAQVPIFTVANHP